MSRVIPLKQTVFGGLAALSVLGCAGFGPSAGSRDLKVEVDPCGAWRLNAELVGAGQRVRLLLDGASVYEGSVPQSGVFERRGLLAARVSASGGAVGRYSDRHSVF